MKKTAVITGAARGIGKAAALKFARAGYDLALSCRKNTDALSAVLKEAESFGVRAAGFTGDMGDPADCEAFFRLAVSTLGSVSCLVNNAGTAHIGLFQDMTPEEWDRMIRTDLSSVFYLSRLAVPEMLKNGGGKIINISSVWGTAGASCEAAYSAAKGGVNAFTKALAKELAPSNIQVNAVAPGTIDTEMNAFLSPEDRVSLEEEIPAGRFGTPEEAADLILTLAESGPYLTGQIITLSGGWMI